MGRVKATPALGVLCEVLRLLKQRENLRAAKALCSGREPWVTPSAVGPRGSRDEREEQALQWLRKVGEGSGRHVHSPLVLRLVLSKRKSRSPGSA